MWVNKEVFFKIGCDVEFDFTESVFQYLLLTDSGKVGVKIKKDYQSLIILFVQI